MAPIEGASRGKALVVIPTFNEAENIPRLIPEILEKDASLEILVVDDGSPDGTAALVRDIMKGNPRVHLIERSGKMGLGTAYVAGFKYAIQAGYDFVFEMDADFSHRPVEIPKFLLAAANADLVIGSRYINGVRVLNWPMQRLALSYTANVYTRFMTGLPLHDATGGFKCYRRSVLEAIDLDRIKSNGYAFQIEMSYKAWKKGFRLIEIPIVFFDRTSGVSKMSKHIIYEAVYMLWTLRLRSFLNRL
jgi:dolichol-phosphate mannosyltransferase